MYRIVRSAMRDEVSTWRLMRDIRIIIELLKGSNYDYAARQHNVGKSTAMNAFSVIRRLAYELSDEDKKALPTLLENPDDYYHIAAFRKDSVFWIKKMEEILAQIQNLGFISGPMPGTEVELHLEIFECTMNPEISLATMEKRFNLRGKRLGAIAQEVYNWFHDNFLTKEEKAELKPYEKKYDAKAVREFWSKILLRYREQHKLAIRDAAIPMSADLREALIFIYGSSSEVLDKLQNAIDERRQALKERS